MLEKKCMILKQEIYGFFYYFFFTLTGVSIMWLKCCRVSRNITHSIRLPAELSILSEFTARESK